MKSLTINQYRNVFAGIKRLALQAGMDKDSFRHEMESWFADINDGEKGENEVRDADDYCTAALRTAVEYGVSREECLKCYDSPSDLNKRERERWIFLSEVTSERKLTKAEKAEFKALNKRMVI